MMPHLFGKPTLQGHRFFRRSEIERLASLIAVTVVRTNAWLLVSILAFVHGEAFATESPAGLREAVAAFAKERVAYRYAISDLNDDHIMDAVVLLTGSNWCGSGGCTMLVFSGTKTGYKLVSSGTVTSEPVSVLPSVSHSWHTLLVYSRPNGVVVMPFDGKRYPPNPSLQRAATSIERTNGRRLSFILENQE
jgi:hypothetical protein